jgi:DNA repair photolyase
VQKPRPVRNPPNRFAQGLVEYFGEEVPEAELEIYEDQTQNVLAENDSPDIGFRWSINPYRGCFHACAYCVSGDTPVLLPDSRTKRLAEIAVGDRVVGTQVKGRYRRYVETVVLAHWSTVRRAHRATFDDGSELICSGDHRFLTRRGWKHVVGTECGSERRPHLTPRDLLLGLGPSHAPPRKNLDYRHGYLCGLLRGDALSASYEYDGRRRARDVQHQFRLALVDLEALRRAADYLQSFAVHTRQFEFKNASGAKPMAAIRTQARSQVERMRGLIEFPDRPAQTWQKGFLAGLFDAEGSYGRGVLRFSNKDSRLLGYAAEALTALGFASILEATRDVMTVRLRGGLAEHVRFFQQVDPAVTRKRTFDGAAVKQGKTRKIARIEDLGFNLPLYDITTGSGDFIADGVISHNCYARPTHEYLSFGAGTDFERKIVIKPQAPALLRERFEKPSWRGELIMLSGNTDCYQPLENTYRLTRGILEVCAEYRNPVHVITKSPLIERDVDLLLKLEREASVGVSISIPFWKTETARALEPFVTTPERRMKTAERLAAAGIDVTINIAPLILGLGDRDVAAILEAAATAGVKRAALIPLRLPGAVKEVFEERLRAAFPLSAEKVLRRTREMRGGKLYDPRFGQRMTAEGLHFQATLQLFEKTCQRLGLNQSDERERPSTFRRPTDKGGQLRLFDR